MRAVADRDRAAVDRADDALAGHRSEVGHLDRRDAALLARRATMAAASGCSLTRSRLAHEPEQRRLVDASLRRPTVDERGLALGQRAGLVDDDRVDLLQHFQRLGVAEQHAQLRAAAGADHDRHRRGEAERARARDDEHGDRVDERVRQARLGPHRWPRRRT